MVVSLWGPGNRGYIEFAVFRWDGEAWQFVMKQPAAASITAAGPDIRQTLPVYRPADARCCPTGGTKERIWHWNGSRFEAGPWKQTTKGKAEPKQYPRFRSPSGNIHCWMETTPSSGVMGCQSGKAPRRVNMGADGRLKICAGIRCGFCGCDPPNERTLGYGEQIAFGRFRCLSLTSGVRCTVIQSGKGFLINRDGVSRVGP